MRTRQEPRDLRDRARKAGAGAETGAAAVTLMAVTRGRLSAAGRARGVIVVAVLWMLAALAALVLIYLTYVTNTTVTVAGNTDHVQADALVNAAVELAAYQLTAKGEARPTSGTFNARIGAGRVSVTFRSEAARID